jgi:site-specific recombinase XerD
LIAAAGEEAVMCYNEFFDVCVLTDSTRNSYRWAIADFLGWCEGRGIGLADITADTLADYAARTAASKRSVNVRVCAVRKLLNWLAAGNIVSSQEARRGGGYLKGIPDVTLSAADVRHLLRSIDTASAVGLRDLALLSVMAYSPVRVAALLGLRVGDYERTGEEGWLWLQETDGTRRRIQVDQRALAPLDAYRMSAKLGARPEGLFFPRACRSDPKGDTPLTYQRADRIVRDRAMEAGLTGLAGCHALKTARVDVRPESNAAVGTGPKKLPPAARSPHARKRTRPVPEQTVSCPES